MSKHHKPVPVTRRIVKERAWRRELHTGFLVPRLNPSGELTHAVGFTAGEYVEYDGEESRKRR